MIRFVPRAAVVLSATVAAFTAVAAPVLVNMAGGRSSGGSAGNPAAAAALVRASALPSVAEPVSAGILAAHAAPRFARQDGASFRIGDTPAAVPAAADAPRSADVPALIPQFSLVRQDAGQFPSLVGAVARMAGGLALGAGFTGVGGGGTSASPLSAAIVPAALGTGGGLPAAVVAPVPEPETWAMLAIGLGVVTWRARQRAGAGQESVRGGGRTGE